jgi:hypothetical protein
MSSTNTLFGHIRDTFSAPRRNREVSVASSVILYFGVIVFSFMFAYWLLRLKVWSAVVSAAIVGQIFINTIFMPVRLDFWSEFDSWTGLYALIQAGTPVVVVIYALTAALGDRRDIICVSREQLALERETFISQSSASLGPRPRVAAAKDSASLFPKIPR